MVINKEKCKHCGFCEKQCPVSNIKQEGYPIHGNKCEFCMRCIAHCPQRAVYIKGKEGIVVRKYLTNMDQFSI